MYGMHHRDNNEELGRSEKPKLELEITALQGDLKLIQYKTFFLKIETL